MNRCLRVILLLLALSNNASCNLIQLYIPAIQIEDAIASYIPLMIPTLINKPFETFKVDNDGSEITFTGLTITRFDFNPNKISVKTDNNQVCIQLIDFSTRTTVTVTMSGAKSIFGEKNVVVSHSGGSLETCVKISKGVETLINVDLVSATVDLEGFRLDIGGGISGAIANAATWFNSVSGDAKVKVQNGIKGAIEKAIKDLQPKLEKIPLDIPLASLPDYLISKRLSKNLALSEHGLTFFTNACIHKKDVGCEGENIPDDPKIFTGKAFIIKISEKYFEQAFTALLPENNINFNLQENDGKWEAAVHIETHYSQEFKDLPFQNAYANKVHAGGRFTERPRVRFLPSGVFIDLMFEFFMQGNIFSKEFDKQIFTNKLTVHMIPDVTEEQVIKLRVENISFGRIHVFGPIAQITELNDLMPLLTALTNAYVNNLKKFEVKLSDYLPEGITLDEFALYTENHYLAIHADTNFAFTKLFGNDRRRLELVQEPESTNPPRELV